MLIKVKSQKLRKTKLQLYHGHTTIELKNVRTGSRERIESDNEFTLGIEHFLQNSGKAMNSPFGNSNWMSQPLYRRLLGGIFLFDSKIEAVNGVYPTLMPAGTKMIANGSFGVVNNANPTEFGSFNSNESAFNANGLTFVYDWTTSQGNGNIECVSLTSDVGGYMGYGNSVSQVAHGATPYTILSYQSSTAIDDHNYVISVKGNDLYAVTDIDMTNNEFTFTKKSIVVNSLDIFDATFAKTITKSIPSQMQGTNRAFISSVGGKFINVPTSLVANTAYTLGIYDIEADEWDYVTFTAPESHGVAVGGYSPLSSLGCEDCCYLASTASDYNYTHSRTRVNYSDGSASFGVYGAFYYEMTDGLLIHQDTWTASGRDNTVYITDFVNNTKYPVNSASLGENAGGCMQLTKDQFINTVGVNAYDRTPTMRIYHNPLYLATINNLDNAVVKTTSDTMKVIYTVTPM